jgi:acyl phosphate:glycerol-3-phosphate acyltransferase
MDNSSFLLIWCACTYVIAAIPFGLIIAAIKKVDLRSVGSGNIGATNVYRAMGKKYALLVFFLDAAKGWLPTWGALLYFENPWNHVVIGIIAILGNSLSCFAKFRGGKGVATGLGVIMGLSPMIATSVLIMAASLIYITRYVALTSIVCAIITPVLFYSLNYPGPYILMLACIGTIIAIRHYTNIIRLIQGKENKI